VTIAPKEEKYFKVLTGKQDLKKRKKNKFEKILSLKIFTQGETIALRIFFRTLLI